MKKFRLFAMLAVLATFSTVFAAWTYSNYADEYTSEGLKFEVGLIPVDSVEKLEAIEISVAAEQTLKVEFEQAEDNEYEINAVVSGPVTVTVEELEDGAADKYDFSFGIYSIYEFAGEETFIPSEAGVKKTPITVSNREATISETAIAEYFNYEMPAADNFEDFKSNLEDFNSTIDVCTGGEPICLKVYATKKTA